MTIIPHDLWTASRINQWEAMTAEDRGREFDARLAAGHRLVPMLPGTQEPTTGVELRRRFVTGEHGFDAFRADEPVFPLLIGPGSTASTPIVPKATTPTPTVKAAAPVMPVVHLPVAAPPPPPPAPTKASIDTAALWQRRREAQTPHHGASEGRDGDQGKPGTGAARIDPSAVYARRRGA